MKKTKTKKKKKVILKKLAAFIKHPFNRKNEPLLHTFEWVFILLAFFAVGLPIIYSQSTGKIFGEGKLSYIGNQEAIAPPTEEQKKFIGETVVEPVDTTAWDTYRNQWYGFEIHHPDSWTNMQFRTATSKNSRYETVYKFRKDSSGGNDPYVGFNVVVYSTKKAASVEETNDLQKKEDAPEDLGSCQLFQELTLGEENNVFQKVSVSAGNACFEPTFFFSATNGGYLYNIIPVAKDGAEPPVNFEEDVNKNFPEYNQVVSSLKFIPISRSAAKKAAPAKPRINAPRPVSAKIAGGRLICAKKNDHPGKSQNGNKPGHMDMECCLDPDERPNPWCTYSNPKYQKYLK
jgi:hypothetical protein